VSWVQPSANEQSERATFSALSRNRKLFEPSDLDATFMNYRSILTVSGRAVYTDITFKVHEVYKAQAGRAFPGFNLTVSVWRDCYQAVRPGFVIPNAATRAASTTRKEISAQVVVPQSVGDFCMVGDNRDISDGTFRPNTTFTRSLARQGRSTPSGLTTD
jgi:hypothetical protein